jgi:hypothetical protein
MSRYLKGDVTSIQCTIGLNWSTSEREIDGLRLTLINFYVSALTPLLHRSGAALHLSENMTLFMLCDIYARALGDHLGFGGIIYIQTIIYNTEDKTHPFNKGIAVDQIA